MASSWIPSMMLTSGSIPRVGETVDGYPRPTTDDPTARARVASAGVGRSTVELDDHKDAPAVMRNAVSHANKHNPAHRPAPTHDQRRCVWCRGARLCATVRAATTARPSTVEATGHTKLWARTCASTGGR